MWMRDMAVVVAKVFKPMGYNVPTGKLPYAALWYPPPSVATLCGVL